MDKNQFDLALKVGGIIVLIVLLLFILTWSGIVKCSAISPYYCDFYEIVKQVTNYTLANYSI